MSTLENRCLELIPEWLSGLGQDALKMADGLGPERSIKLRRAAARSLTFLVRSLDLIEDVEEQGFAEAAIVLRLSAEAIPEAERETEETGTLSRLAADGELIRELLADDYLAFAAYLEQPSVTAYRGMILEQLLEDPEASAELSERVQQFAEGYRAPEFANDPKSLIKLRSYLRAKSAVEQAQEAAGSDG